MYSHNAKEAAKILACLPIGILLAPSHVLACSYGKTYDEKLAGTVRKLSQDTSSPEKKAHFLKVYTHFLGEEMLGKCRINFCDMNGGLSLAKDTHTTIRRKELEAFVKKYCTSDAYIAVVIFPDGSTQSHNAVTGKTLTY